MKWVIGYRKVITTKLKKNAPFERRPAPPEEIAKALSSREFLFINEISLLAGVDTEIVMNIVRNFGLKPYKLETRSGQPIDAYMTFQVKKMLAARGRIIPGFNHEEASQRQWLEILEQAVRKPLDEDWYFFPVNPEPLITISEESATKILNQIAAVFKMEGSNDEKLRLIADTINVEVREDLPMQANSRWKMFGKPGFKRMTLKELRKK